MSTSTVSTVSDRWRAGGDPFELASPVRSFAAFKGQKNFTGEYWAATSGSQVGYESWVERDAAMALDLDPTVVALASQPFRIVWTAGERRREHTPDYFARLVDGTGVVVDVRPRDLIDEDTAKVFAFIARVCEAVGWQFRHVGDLDQPYRVNLRWLARYRRRRCHREPVADRFRDVFVEPLPVLVGAEQAADRLSDRPAPGLAWPGQGARHRLRGHLRRHQARGPGQGGTGVDRQRARAGGG
ncbi:MULTISPECIES: TnsA-like heteromeric transposase endonuclease subunit [unclassified Kitasatospora]|uniref:TnsA-like heteromeric transposase endonuclease subunit n=1 Tax=unclassified Kitasatospora TaxID=2633591 RepID=UPI0038131707